MTTTPIVIPDYTQKLLPAPATTTRSNGNGHNGNGHAPKPKADPFDLAPHSVDAEEAVLGSTLMNPGSLCDTARILDDQDFFLLRHGYIWEAVLHLYNQGTPIDTRILAERLKDQDRLEYIGGEAYLRYLPTVVPTSLHAKAYAEIVKRAAMRRQLLGAAGAIAQLAHSEELDIFQVIEKAQEAVLKISQESTRRQADSLDAYTLASQFLDTLEGWRAGTKEVGILTPWPDFNHMTGGFLNGDLIVVAGPTSIGKSSWIIQAALFAAQKGKRVWLGSNEMTRQQIMARMVALLSGVSTHYNDVHNCGDEIWCKLVKATSEVAMLPIEFAGIRGCTDIQVRDRIREYHHSNGLDIAFVDYLNNFTDPGQLQRHDLYLKQCTLTLHELAGALDIPVVLAAQLSGDIFRRTARQGEDKYKVKRPRLGDLFGSSGIGQTAETIIFIHRDSYWMEKEEGVNPADLTRDQLLADGIVAKQRNGPTGDFPMIWKPETTEFVSPATKQQVEKAAHYANDL